MKLWRILNILSLVLTLVVNGLANGLPLNGKNTGEISNSFRCCLPPPGMFLRSGD